MLKVSVNISTDYHEQKMVPQKIFPHTFKAESYVGLVPKNLNVKLLRRQFKSIAFANEPPYPFERSF